jgi:lactoylglutathione lyase
MINYFMIAYGYTILYVDNVEKTLLFYAEAFGFAQKFLTPEKDYGELATGGTTLAFADYSIAEYNGITLGRDDKRTLPLPFEVTFVTDDIAHAWKQAVDAGALVVKEPVQKPWGQTVGYLRDINGFLVELCTPVA